MRRFWLKKDNKIWDLSSDVFMDTASFMAQPQGLGVRAKIDSFEVEQTCFIESVRLESQEISGRIYFKDYAQFEAFSKFIGYIETKSAMRLYYSTSKEKPDYTSTDEWYKNVLIKELTKTEIDLNTGVLICDIKFRALSRWKKDRAITLELSPLSGPLTYPYVYPYYYGGQSNVGVYIDNTGGLPTHCTVKIEPETDTPQFRIIQNDTVVEKAQYYVYIRPGSYLIVNSDPAAQEACIYTGEDKEDVYYLGEKDYTYSNFLTIPSGESLFLFSARNTQFGRVTLSYSLTKELV